MQKRTLGLKPQLRRASKAERASLLDALPYPVGFGKPSRRSRFSSVNQPRRHGRPRGSENLDRIVQEESAATVDVSEGGKRRRLSKGRVIVRQLINQAAAGNLKAAALVLELQRKIQHGPADDIQVLDRRDLEAIERILDLLAQATPSAPLHSEDER